MDLLDLPLGYVAGIQTGCKYLIIPQSHGKQDKEGKKDCNI